MQVVCEPKFKDIKGYEGLYEINELGEIRSLPRLVETGILPREVGDKILKPFKRTDGRYYVNLYSETKKREPVHRLVAETFMPGYVKGRKVFFKDKDESNYRLDNLTFDRRYAATKLADSVLILINIDTFGFHKCNNAKEASKIIGCSPSLFYREEPKYIIRNFLVHVIPK